jgi:cytoplasmic iron level regulating protein YaaA (DUF328/UPF0246 family)
MRNMKKPIYSLLAAAIMIGAFALVSVAQDGRERITFAKGKTAAAFTRTISGDGGAITFIAKARKGQRMHFTVESDSALNIELSEYRKQDFTIRSEPNEPNEFIVKNTYDHYITVVNTTGSAAKFTLRISIK